METFQQFRASLRIPTTSSPIRVRPLPEFHLCKRYVFQKVLVPSQDIPDISNITRANRLANSVWSLFKLSYPLTPITPLSVSFMLARIIKDGGPL